MLKLTRTHKHIGRRRNRFWNFLFWWIFLKMGSKMKPTVFNERVATALKSWHHTAKKQIKHGRTSGSTTPFSSRPTTPTHGSSPIHLLRNVHKRSRSADESFANTLSPRNSNFDSWRPEPQQEPSSSSANHHSRFRKEDSEKMKPSSSSLELPPGPGQIRTHQHEISISLRDFSFKGWFIFSMIISDLLICL